MVDEAIRRALVSVVLSCLFLSTPATGETREAVGQGRLFSNDFLGDGQDRWRTGSYVISQIQSPVWNGALPTEPGELLEYRLRTEIIAPSNLISPALDDRRFVGLLSFGLHTHFDRAGQDTSFGLDIAVTGPQTGLSHFQKNVHDLVGQAAGDYSQQLGNAVYPTILFETGREITFGGAASARPFIEIQAGIESFVRAGADMVLGGCRSGLSLRDVTTGHRYDAIPCREGVNSAITFGADIANVFDSYLLPSSDGYELTDVRTRVRAGVTRAFARGRVFYGLTWLGEEFNAQDDAQVVGSININLDF